VRNRHPYPHSNNLSYRRDKLGRKLTLEGINFPLIRIQQGEGLSTNFKASLTVNNLLHVILVLAVCICLYLLRSDRIEIKKLRQEYRSGLLLIQQLDSGIDPILKRQSAILKYRDVILEVNNSIPIDQAYTISSDNYDLSQKYGIDPNLLLALQRQESRFNAKAISPMGARGLNQIMPSTGRLLARALGWSYSDDLLFDTRSSTEMACLYIQTSQLTYASNEAVLATYNGGFKQAHYYITKSSRLSSETRDYVKKVMKYYRELSS